MQKTCINYLYKFLRPFLPFIFKKNVNTYFSLGRTKHSGATTYDSIGNFSTSRKWCNRKARLYFWAFLISTN